MRWSFFDWKILFVLLCHASALGADAPTFQGLGDFAGGDHHSEAAAVSADGRTVVGFGTTEQGEVALRWTDKSGLLQLGEFAGGRFASRAHSVSQDGSLVVGFSNSGRGDEGFYWTEKQGLAALPLDATFGATLTVLDVSADGKVFVGRFADRERTSFIWRRDRGYTLLDANLRLAGKSFEMIADASAVSQNGRVAVGSLQSNQIDLMSACLWVDGQGAPLRRKEFSEGVSLPGFVGTRTLVRDVTCDEQGHVQAITGQYVNKKRVGVKGYWIGDKKFHWLENNATVLSHPEAVSGNGVMVVGRGRAGEEKSEACVWTAAGGVVRLAAWLQQQGVDLDGWRLSEATGVSHDASVIVGTGVNPQGDTEAWIVRLPNSKPTQPFVIKRANADRPAAARRLSAAFAAGAVLKGRCRQAGYKPYEMEIHISKRDGTQFEGFTVFPSLRGRARFRGAIEGDSVSFRSYERLQGRLAVPCAYSATVEGDSLQGRWRVGRKSDSFYLSLE